jgi:hypothetical protein
MCRRITTALPKKEKKRKLTKDTKKIEEKKECKKSNSTVDRSSISAGQTSLFSITRRCCDIECTICLLQMSRRNVSVLVAYREACICNSTHVGGDLHTLCTFCGIPPCYHLNKNIKKMDIATTRSSESPHFLPAARVSLGGGMGNSGTGM